MKRIKNIVAGLAALVLGSSFAFADKAQYDKLLAEGKQYEEKKQWVHAMGTYWDAMVAYPEGATEANEGFTRIAKAFDGYDRSAEAKGNPGPGEYDDFSRYDGWIELCKDFEIYWTEHADEIVYISNVTCQKGEVDMKSRTATYNFEATESFTPKFDTIRGYIEPSFLYAVTGSRRGDGKYRTDWPELPPQWPGLSIFKDSKTIPVIKFLTMTSNSTRKNDGQYWYLGDELITLVPSKPFYFLRPYEKTTEYYTAAWNNFSTPYYKVSVEGDNAGLRHANAAMGLYSVATNHELKIKITDENKRVIATMTKPTVMTYASRDLNLQGYFGKFYSEFSISGIASSDVKIMDGKKWNWEVESFVSKPKSIVANSTTTTTLTYIVKLEDIKYNTNYPEINLYKAGSAINALEVYKKAMSEQETEKNKASYVQNYFDSRKQTFDNDDGFFWEIRLDTETLACRRQEGENYYDAYKDVIVERKNLDGDYGYNVKINKNTPILGTVDDLLVQLNAMDSKDAKWEVFDLATNRRVFRYLTESEVIQKKQEYLTQYKKAKAEGKNVDVYYIEKWRDTPQGKEIASELYKYLIAMHKYDEGKMHANISDLTLEEKKGVVTVKAVAGKFESKGLKKKDVITQMSLKEYDGSTRTVTASDLPKIPGQSTLTFTVQRDSGKKAQELTIEVPVEWNGQWTGRNWY